MGAVQSKVVPLRELPRVLIATSVVVGLPILAVSLLRAYGVVASTVVLMAIGTVLSLAVSYAGAALWAASSRTGDTLFGDLMLWGWLRRWHTERQVASAMALLGRPSGSGGGRDEEVGAKRREQLLRRLATGLEARDPNTFGHSRRVARHAAAIAKRMGLSPEQVARVRAAAAVHDVGKIETPESVLKKPGALTDEEFAVIKEHSVVGERMVMGLDDGELSKIVRHHHERLDGKGYPDGLVGEEIPIGARIVAVADTFDAITSARPYRSGRSHREGLKLLSAEAGKQLDPDAVRAFRSYYSGLRSVAVWSFLSNGPRQFFSSLPDQVRLGNVGLASKVAATAAATVAAGSVAVGSLTPVAQGHGGGAPAGERLVSYGSPAASRSQEARGPDSSAEARARASMAIGGESGAPAEGSPPAAPAAGPQDASYEAGAGAQAPGDGSAGGEASQGAADVASIATDGSAGAGAAGGPPQRGGPPAEKPGPPAGEAGQGPAHKAEPDGGKGDPPGQDETPGHAHEPPGHDEPPADGHEPPGHADEPPGHAHEPPGHADEPPGHAHEPPGHDEPPADGHQPPSHKGETPAPPEDPQPGDPPHGGRR